MNSSTKYHWLQKFAQVQRPGARTLTTSIAAKDAVAYELAAFLKDGSDHPRGALSNIVLAITRWEDYSFFYDLFTGATWAESSGLRVALPADTERARALGKFEHWCHQRLVLEEARAAANALPGALENQEPEQQTQEEQETCLERLKGAHVELICPIGLHFGQLRWCEENGGFWLVKTGTPTKRRTGSWCSFSLADIKAISGISITLGASR